MKITLKEAVYALLIAAVLAALDLTIMPTILFVNISWLDIEPIYLSIIINQWLLIILGLIAIRYLCPNLVLGLKKAGARMGLKRFLPTALIMMAMATFAFYIGLVGHYNYTTTVWKVLIEVFIYNVGLGFLEELYVRGLLLNSIERFSAKRKNATFIAIIISSFLFSFGHLPGMIGLDAFTIILRLIWTLMLGIYFGVIYKQTNNLWVPIIAHALINFSALPFYFTTKNAFPQISVIIIMLTSVVIATWSVYVYFKEKKEA
mgnify:CR=1 FL=1|jgi:hypothetical protein